MNRESVYNKLPIFAQNLIVNMEGWKIKHRRFGGNYKNIYKTVLQREYLSAEELRRYQEKRLYQVLKTAEKYSPYYKQLFRKYSFDTNTPRLTERLKNLPILTKEQVKKHANQVLACNIPRQNLIPCHTSGTTGSGLHFYETRKAEQERWAMWWRYRRTHGITPKTWCAYFGGRSIVSIDQNKPPYWRKNISGKQLLFSAYHLSRATALNYVNALRKSKITWIHGYPSVLTLLSWFILEDELDPGQNIKHITIGAENLFLHQRKIIEKAFGIKVHQHYGLAESVASISECEYGKLHVDEDYSIVEFVPIDDKHYHLIGTSLINPVFLFLRYDTGDIVQLKKGTCLCGRLGRLIKKIDGRREDYIILSKGRLIGRLDHIFKDLVNIHEAQIYQKELGQIEIRIVKGRYYTDQDEKKLLEEARKRVGQDIKIIIQYIDKIKRTNTGKLRFVISEINKGKLSKFKKFTI